MPKSNFKPVVSDVALPKIEEAILDFWKKNQTFAKSLENRQKSPNYYFYDGPPFATGTPHYGNLVASTIKDVIPRYFTMKGFLVDRKWGWDCHGLPIENIAEKDLKISHKKEILTLGVAKFNEYCRSKILEYVDDWKKVITRLGRWVDMENAYKTMDTNFMESVWWVFKELYNKNLIYEGYRSMHICPRCETTLSQSEVAEGYKEVKDLSAIVKFEIVDEPGTYLLAWTTTPWTLLGNVALAVNDKIKYVKVECHSCPSSCHSREGGNPDRSVDSRLRGNDNEKTGNDEEKNENDKIQTSVKYIIAKDRIKDVFKDQDCTIIEEFKGQKLVGKKYKPLFDFSVKEIKNAENVWNVYAADFVADQEGTGIVHVAPAFGEDDLELSKKENLPFIQHIGMDGIIKPGFGQFSGLSVKPIEDVQATDVEIIKYLAHQDLLFDKQQYLHAYPHCWRCETPLLNYATSSWFVNVSKLKTEALKIAESINWFPKHIKSGRFGKWLEGARDWSISRQRFWASVIPIWKCDGEAEIKNQKSKIKDYNHNLTGCGNLVVVGSIRELKELSGQKVTDLHKHIVDEISFPCSKCRGKMKRIPDVLDTWFDSGSMPYAQKHYPFENKKEFDSSFPANFIAEGADQTRAWFYYLHILSTALKGKPAFKNAVVNGIVLAEDGKKMSKRLNNYPDPALIFDKYGADTLRLYLMSSPVVTAENLNFSEKEVAELHRGLFRMLWNGYSFFVLYANIDGFKPDKSIDINPINLLDKWIIGELQSLISQVTLAMDSYNLSKAARLFVDFIDRLSNWYIRRSRKRFWKTENDQDKKQAYQTLWSVLVKLSQLMAPFTPFVSEEIYQNLTNEESVHLTNYPTANKELIDQKLISNMEKVRHVVEIALAKRNEVGIKVRQPLKTLYYSGSKLETGLEEIIAEEVNVKSVINEARSGNLEVKIDINITNELLIEGEARELVRQIQQLRKKAGFSVDDRILVYFEKETDNLKKILTGFNDYLKKEVLANDIDISINKKMDFRGEIMVVGEKMSLGFLKAK